MFILTRDRVMTIFLMLLLLASTSVFGQGRSNYLEDIPECESTPIDWCSWVTAVICLPLSEDKCVGDDPLDPSSITWPSDLANTVFGNTYWYYIANETDSVQIDDGSGFVNFTIASYHDSCVAVYRVADFLYDTTRLEFDTWDLGVTHKSWDELTLADKTQSNAFKLEEGKTLSFYRELSWAHPETREQTVSNYLSLDTLSYTVELRNDADGSRIEVLDTMSVLRRTTPGAPSKYGTNAIMAVIEYEVPAEYDGVDAHVRVVPIARGNGSYKFGRHDYMGFELSEKPLTSEGAMYISTYGAGMPKPVVRWQELVGEATRQAAMSQLALSSDRVALFQLDGVDVRDSDITVMVVDLEGRTWTKRDRLVGHGRTDITFECNFPHTGLFFVVAYDGVNPIALSKVLVP